MGLTGFVIIHVFIVSFSPAQGERNQILNAKFTKPVNAMPLSTSDACMHDGACMSSLQCNDGGSSMEHEDDVKHVRLFGIMSLEGGNDGYKYLY